MGLNSRLTYLPSTSIERVRTYVASRYPDLAKTPTFDTIIKAACRTDVSIAEKGRMVGKEHRRVLACAVLQAELECQALGCTYTLGKIGNTFPD
jgi:hypothetical protein